MNRLISFLFVAIVLYACNSEKQDKKDSTPENLPQKESKSVVKDSLKKGSVIKALSARNDQSISYDLYIPSSYNYKTALPAIVLFDAHANSELAINSFKNTAEKRNYIVAASNSSKNGMPFDLTATIGNKIINDLKARLYVDPSRIYAGGFSGGARAAVYMAEHSYDIKGVVACGAGLPNNEKLNNTFALAGIVGKYDFNYLEMLGLNKSLNRSGFPSCLITWDGEHEWPGDEQIDMSVLFLDMDYLRSHKNIRNDSAVNAAQQYFYSKIEASDDLIEKNQLFDNYILFFKNIAPVDSIVRVLENFRKQSDFQKELQYQQGVLAEEEKVKQLFFNSFVSQSVDWWINQIDNIRKKYKATDEEARKQSYARRLGYVSILGYSHSDNALSSGQIDYAGKFLEVYHYADPNNPDCSYLWSCFHALKGDTTKSIGTMKNAVLLGFNDWDKMKSDSRLSVLFKTKYYKQLVDSLDKNR
ncbi:MAG: hypothetical protein C0594_12545 [Marinilabiliales bacterium]|nr:MAG: hypothetical protein C0594_12545 [Marinilabiliales bacterium]